MSTPAYLSTAYLAPVQYYCKLVQYPVIYMETCENYLKQTYRNRCTIVAANGPLSLSVPVEKPEDIKCPTKEIRISDHGNWRHLHWNALLSAYNMSPFFEYYADEFAPFYETKYTWLLDFNQQLQELICSLIDIHPVIHFTEQYIPEVENDYRESIRPKHVVPDPGFFPSVYYQTFREKHGFIPNMSIVDLLFNMGPESILTLQSSIRPTTCGK